MDLQKELKRTLSSGIQPYSDHGGSLGHENAGFWIDKNRFKTRFEVLGEKRVSRPDFACLRRLELAEFRGHENLPHVRNLDGLRALLPVGFHVDLHVQVAWSRAYRAILAGQVRGDDERNGGRARAVLDAEVEFGALSSVHPAQVERWGRRQQEVCRLCCALLQRLDFICDALVLAFERLCAREVVDHFEREHEAEEGIKQVVGRVDEI